MKRLLIHSSAFMFLIVYVVFGLFLDLWLPSPIAKKAALINSEFSGQFSWDKYNQITQGSSKSQVDNLGTPFRVFSNCHAYSKGKGSPFTIPPFTLSPLWAEIVICVDDSGKVTNKGISVFDF